MPHSSAARCTTPTYKASAGCRQVFSSWGIGFKRGNKTLKLDDTPLPAK
jgi:hypothetical protein